MTDKLRYLDVQTLTGIRITTLYSMVSRKQIPHLRLGRRLVVFSRRELEQWMALRHVACPPPRFRTSSRLR